MESQQHAEALYRVVNSLRRITQAIRVASSVAQETLGVTGAQLFVLQQIAECPGASLRELAERTLTAQTAVSAVVNRLVDARHVTRRASKGNGPRAELTLTDTGRWLVQHAPELPQVRMIAGLRAMPSSQLRVAANVLDRATRAMQARTGPAPMFFEPMTGKRRGAVRPRKQGAAAGRGNGRRSSATRA